MIKNNLGVENEKFTMISHFAVVSGLFVCNALGLATVACAGEGGVAGSAAFTIDTNGSVRDNSAIFSPNATSFLGRFALAEQVQQLYRD